MRKKMLKWKMKVPSASNCEFSMRQLDKNHCLLYKTHLLLCEQYISVAKLQRQNESQTITKWYQILSLKQDITLYTELRWKMTDRIRTELCLPNPTF